jgi:hypothetical protein
MAVRTSVTSNLTNTALDKLREQSAAELPTRQEQVIEEESSDSPQQPSLFDQAATMDTPQQESQVLPASLEDSTQDQVLQAVAGMTEQMAEKQLDIQAAEQAGMLPDIRTRKEQDLDPDYDYLGQFNNSIAGDGGLANRANALSMAIETKDFKLGKLDQQKSNLRPVLEKAGAYDVNTALPTRDFTYIMALVTEDALIDMSNAADRDADVATDVNIFDLPESSNQQMEVAFTKAQGNKKLGDRINREYQRYQRRVNPNAKVQELSNEEAILLGDFAKESFAAFHGPAMIARADTADGQTTFAFTKEGMNILNGSERERKRMFPKVATRPLKAPPPRGRLEGDIGKEKRRVSTKGGEVVGAKTINQAMQNLSQVANVVDKDRLKILYMTALPVLRNPTASRKSVVSIINHLGQDKINKFEAKVESDKRKGKPPSVDPEVEYSKLVNNLAQDLYGITIERKGANYLTYYMQGFNGRIAPQQSTLDPTTSKSARFVTRNAAPSIASDIDSNGRRVHRNLRQMYANALVKDADSLLPAAREVALQKATPQMVKWGVKLRTIMNGVSDADIEAIAEAIEKRIPINDPSFPKVPNINLDPQADADLINAIRGKGEDGQMYIDGLIDFANYYEAFTKARVGNKPFKYASYFNAYMDGKTNGIASNAMQMGSIEAAFRTGVLRTQNETLLDNNMDIRDQLKELLRKDVDDNGFDGVSENNKGNVVTIAKALFSLKDLNKATTMTFGYGKELDSFKDDLDDFLAVLEQDKDNTEVKDAVNDFVKGDPKKRDELINMLHAKYIPNLISVLDDNALQSRALMRSVAAVGALMNEMFTITTHTGYQLNLGAGISTGVEKRIGYRIQGQKRDAAVFGTEFTSAAERTYRGVNPFTGEEEVKVTPGEIAYGGSVPAPVQSLDAATVAMSVTGKSWNRLTQASGGNPYVHTIYDAFKVDAMGYDVVLQEVNQNWMDASLDWSYLKEAKKSLDQMVQDFNKKNGQLGAKAPLTDNEKKMIDFFSDPKTLQSKLMKYYPEYFNDLKDFTEIEDLSLKFSLVENRVQYARAVYEFYHMIKIEKRLDDMISKTEANKRKLRKKIEDMGVAVYQYYSH